MILNGVRNNTNDLSYRKKAVNKHINMESTGKSKHLINDFINLPQEVFKITLLKNYKKMSGK